jgi:hypothetical protein
MHAKQLGFEFRGLPCSATKAASTNPSYFNTDYFWGTPSNGAASVRQ